MDHDILRYKGRLVLRAKSALVQQILRQYHDTPTGGDLGDFKTYQRLAMEWYWPGMRKQVAPYVQACPTCRQLKTLSLKPTGLLQPLPFLHRYGKIYPWTLWRACLARVDTMLVIVDRLTKYSHFLALKHPFTAATVAQLFVKEIVRLHGFPSTIVSDRDRVFLSLFCENSSNCKALTFTAAPPTILNRMDKRRSSTNGSRGTYAVLSMGSPNLVPLAALGRVLLQHSHTCLHLLFTLQGTLWA